MDYSSLDATKIGTFLVVPDETLAKKGVLAGASVSTTAATIQISNTKTIGDYISFNGTTRVSQNGTFTGITFSGGKLTMTHPDTYDQGYGIGLAPRGAGYLWCVTADSGATTQPN